MPSIASTALSWVADAFGKASRATRRLARRPSKGEQGLASMTGAGGGWPHPTGWGADKFEQARHYRLWTYIAVNAIAEAVARHPVQAAHIRPADYKPALGKKLLTHGQRLKAHTTAQPHEELELVDSDHPLLKLLHNPNRPDVAYTFWHRTMISLELCGEAYWWKVRNGLGLPTELWCLFPQWVTAVPGTDRLVDRYEVRPTATSGGKALVVKPEDMVAFRYPSPLSLLAGYSPLQAGAEWVDTAEAIDSARWYLFENGQWPGMAVELDSDLFGKGAVTDAEINRFYAQFDERIKGKERAGKPIIFRPGMKPSQMTRSPVEMDYIASADQLRDWRLALHRVSKTVAGITEEVNFASMIAARAGFLHDTVGPKLCMISQVVTEQLAHEFDETLCAYWPDLAPEDPAQVNADLAADMAAGAITPNEWRQKRGREPYEFGGDDPMVPFGTTPVPWATGKVDELAHEAAAAHTAATSPPAADDGDADGGGESSPKGGGKDKGKGKALPVEANGHNGHHHDLGAFADRAEWLKDLMVADGPAPAPAPAPQPPPPINVNLTLPDWPEPPGEYDIVPERDPETGLATSFRRVKRSPDGDQAE